MCALAPWSSLPPKTRGTWSSSLSPSLPSSTTTSSPAGSRWWPTKQREWWWCRRSGKPSGVRTLKPSKVLETLFSSQVGNLKIGKTEVLQCFRQGGCQSAGKDASDHHLGVRVWPISHTNNQVFGVNFVKTHLRLNQDRSGWVLPGLPPSWGRLGGCWSWWWFQEGSTEVEVNLTLMSGGWRGKLGGSPFRSISSRNDYVITVLSFKSCFWKNQPLSIWSK